MKIKLLKTRSFKNVNLMPISSSSEGENLVTFSLKMSDFNLCVAVKVIKKMFFTHACFQSFNSCEAILKFRFSSNVHRAGKKRALVFSFSLTMIF